MRSIVLVLVLGLGVVATAFAPDVTGKWLGKVDSPNGPIELTYELKAEGEMVTGTVSSAMGSLPIAKGKLAGDVLTYEVSIEGAVITHDARVNAAGDEIAIKATGEWGTTEYVVKKVNTPK
jgi:hypothetical protein